MSYHTILIVGHLGRDPDMKYTPAGQAVTNFNLATNRRYTASSGEVVQETAWFRVTTWGKNAENCNQYLRKGSLVLVEGRLLCDPNNGGPRLYSRQDGTPGTAFEVNANIVRFLSSRDSEDSAEEADLAYPEGQAEGEEIPF